MQLLEGNSSLALLEKKWLHLCTGEASFAEERERKPKAAGKKRKDVSSATRRIKKPLHTSRCFFGMEIFRAGVTEKRKKRKRWKKKKLRKRLS